MEPESRAAASCGSRRFELWVARITKIQVTFQISCKVRTDLARALWENPKTLMAAEANTPLLRIEVPEDIADAAVSRAGVWTSQTIMIDGGVTIAG